MLQKMRMKDMDLSPMIRLLFSTDFFLSTDYHRFPQIIKYQRYFDYHRFHSSFFIRHGNPQLFQSHGFWLRIDNLHGTSWLRLALQVRGFLFH